MGVYGGYQGWAGRAGRFRSLGDGQVDFTRVFTLLTEAGYRGWAVLEWECCVKAPEQGAAEGAFYPHVRDVLALRVHESPAALLYAGHAQTPEVQRWVDSGWLRQLEGDRSEIRSGRPRVETPVDPERAPFDSVTRLPDKALAVLKEGLRSGPVLVQVARRGYIPTTACASCREIAECPRCGSVLSIAARRDAGRRG